MSDKPGTIGSLLLGCALSASNLMIRIDCDNHDTRDRIMDYLYHLAGPQPQRASDGAEIVELSGDTLKLMWDQIQQARATPSGADVREATIRECAKIAGLQAFKARQSVRSARGPSARAAALAAERTAQEIQKAIIALSADTRPQADVRAALEEIANRAGNFADADAGEWMESIYKIANAALNGTDFRTALSADPRPDGGMGE